MPASQNGSVTGWLRQVKGGDDDAAGRLWDRYFQRIVGIARRRLTGIGAPFDEEDVALSSFDRVIRAIRSDRLDDPADRFEFWGLLRLNAERRLSDRLKMEGAGKRGGGRSPSDERPRHFRSDVALDQLAAQMADPQVELAMSETCRNLLDSLQDDELQQVAIWKLEGLTNDEIANSLGYSRRTVQRMVRNIRELWVRFQNPSAE